MPELIEKAKKGEKEAFLELYNNNKSTVYYICRALLGNEDQADEVAINVFKNSFSALLDGRIEDAKDFAHTVKRKTASYCKTKILNQDSKALRVYHNKSLLEGLTGAGSWEDACDALLKKLPLLHRYIYVLYAVGGLSRDELALGLHTTVALVDSAIFVENRVVERVVGVSYSSNRWNDDMREKAKSFKVSQKVDNAVNEDINATAKVFQDIKKKKTVKALTVAVSCVLAVAVVGLAIFGIIKAINSSTFTTTDASGDVSVTSQDPNIYTKVEIDKSLTYFADIEIENYGTVTVQLDHTYAPITVSNFVNLANKGFYNGLTFHRIMEGFMMQGGDPNGNGTGGAEQDIKGEFSSNGVENPLSHKRGVISMARSSAPNSASSQFFIMHEDSTSLDGDYAAFGWVISGIEIVDKICTEAEPIDNNGTIPAAKQPKIKTIAIRTQSTDESSDENASDDVSEIDASIDENASKEEISDVSEESTAEEFSNASESILSEELTNG